MRKIVPSDHAIDVVLKLIDNPSINLGMIKSAFQERRALYVGSQDLILALAFLSPIPGNESFLELRFLWVHPQSRNQGLPETLMRRMLLGSSGFKKENILTVVPSGNHLIKTIAEFDFVEVSEWTETPNWPKMLPGANKKHLLFWRSP